MKVKSTELVTNMSYFNFTSIVLADFAPFWEEAIYNLIIGDFQHIHKNARGVDNATEI